MIDSRRQTSHSESNEGSPLSPFRHRLFVWIWVGNAVSALGTWIQATASAWVMTDLAPNPLMVSLVQAASQLPILMLAIPAGALADIVDRRRLLLWTNLGMLAASGALAVFQVLGLISVWTLLGLTMLLAAFSALNDPAWAASVPTTVPRRALTQALILNSIGFNVARSIGPAIGGLIVAVLGAAAAFAANAASFAIVAILIGAFLALPRTPHIQGVPPESMVPAVRVGLRYAMAEPVVRVALVRSGAFYLFASAIWALLPLYVRDILALSSASYGLMLGAIGVGAVLGGVLMPQLRRRISRDSCVMLAGLLTSGALIPVSAAEDTQRGHGFHDCLRHRMDYRDNQSPSNRSTGLRALGAGPRPGTLPSGFQWRHGFRCRGMGLARDIFGAARHVISCRPRGHRHGIGGAIAGATERGG